MSFFLISDLRRDIEVSHKETEERSAQLQETAYKLQTVRDTLKDATEVNNYKAKELKDKVNKVFFTTFISCVRKCDIDKN